MYLSERIRRSLQEDSSILSSLSEKTPNVHWDKFTRTQFNIIADTINKRVTQEALKNTDLVIRFMIIGKQQLEKEMQQLHSRNPYDFIEYMETSGKCKVFNWISGKTLHSYWKGGEAKYIKINALLVYLQIPIAQWSKWQRDVERPESVFDESLSKFAVNGAGCNQSSMSVIKSKYVGNYYLYYQKTDGTSNIVKTPFVLKENDNGQVYVKYVSEGHRYYGKVMGIKDGCLYITCQNLDFEEMEQYIFTIGPEAKYQVLFGVSTTVRVKKKQAVALKNIIVKQPDDPNFECIPETEISFSREYDDLNEEALVVNYLKRRENNIITTSLSCSLDEMRNAQEFWTPALQLFPRSTV